MEYYARTRYHSVEKIEVLLNHLSLVGALAKQYGREIKSENITEILGYLHDAGKRTDKFQKVLDKQLSHLDHAEVSAQVLKKLRDDGDLNVYDDRLLYIMMNILAGHHSIFREKYADPFSIENNTKDANGATGIFRLPVDFSVRNITEDDGKENVLSSMDEFNDIVNYIKSNNLVPYTNLSAGIDLDSMSKAARMLYCRMLFSCLVDADYTCSAYAEAHPFYKYDDIPSISKALLENDRTISDDSLLQKLDAMHDSFQKPEFVKLPINILRNRVYNEAALAGQNCTPGLYTMTAPTGLGKTLALIKFALEQAKRNGQKRVIVVLPFLSIITQNAQTYKEVFGDDIVIEADSSVHDRAIKQLADKWDAPIIVTTTVSFFETLFTATAPKLRKLHRVANSVVVFDESQALNHTLQSVTIRTLEALGKHFNTTVLLSTATQPLYNARTDLNADITEIIDDIPTLYKDYAALKNTGVDFLVDKKNPSDYTDIADHFKAETEALYIVNTTKKARKMYETVKQLHPGNTLLLTGLQTPLDKKCTIDKARDILKSNMRTDNKTPIHLVSTQCIEAGVDVDFKTGCREYAPLTSIIQSAGRINRECKRNGHMLVFLLNDTFEAAPSESYIFESRVSLSMARKACKQGNCLDINNPNNINIYYKNVYSGTEGHDKGYNQRECVPDTISYAEAEENMKLMGEKYKIIEDDERLTVIVPSKNDVNGIYDQLLAKFESNSYELEKKDMITAHDISVSVIGSKKNMAMIAAKCKPLYCKGEPTGWYVGTSDIYDSETGLCMS